MGLSHLCPEGPELSVTEEGEGTRGGLRWVEPPQGHSLDRAGQTEEQKHGIFCPMPCHTGDLGLSPCGGK